MASLNAGPEYYAAEEKYRQAKTTEEKLAALREMLAYAPKHKGSQSILFEIKKRISALKEEALVERKKKAGRRGGGDFIKKQGAAQVVLLGFANSGKTALFNRLCNLHFPSSDIPFETKAVVPGMLEHEKMQLQVLDTPSITGQNMNKLFGIARLADLSLIILDPMQPIDAQASAFGKLEARRIFLVSKKMLSAKASSDHETYEVFSDNDISRVRKLISKNLDLIRVFTKSPHGGVDREKPFVIAGGSTVSDLARQIHKEFYQNLKFARVWGSSKFPGQQVSSDYRLKDGDIVELHMK